MKQILSLILIVILLSGCKQDDNISRRIYFTGITKRDINAQQMSADDSTDWRTGDNWTSQESGLFDNVSYLSNCTQQHVNKLIVYPNPCSGLFVMNFDKLPATRVELRVVDENFNKLVSMDTLTRNIVPIDAGATGIKDNVRVYYRFIEGNCEFRGHGDILIQ